MKNWSHFIAPKKYLIFFFFVKFSVLIAIKALSFDFGTGETPASFRLFLVIIFLASSEAVTAFNQSGANELFSARPALGKFAFSKFAQNVELK